MDKHRPARSAILLRSAAIDIYKVCSADGHQVATFGKEGKCMSRISLTMVLFIGIGTTCTFAQTPGNASADQSTDSVVQPSSSHPEETIPGKSQDQRTELLEKGGWQFTGLLKGSRTQSVGLLNGTGLMSMDSDNGLIFSAEARGGWDSNPSNLSNSIPSPSSMYSLSPYIAFHGISARNRFFIQYQPTFLRYSSGTYAGQTVHASSIQADGSLNERLGWKININGSSGQNDARFVEPMQSVPVDEVPAIATSSASYLPNSESVAYVFASLQTDYRTSERGTAVINLSNSYNSVTGYDQAGGTATGRFRYSYNLSPTLSVTLYGQASHYYGDLHCQSIGGGGGVDWRLGVSTKLAFEAGPQINTAACGDQQGYSYALEYSARLSSQAQFYLIANRLPMVSYLGPGVWQRNAAAGMQYELTRLALLRVDVGYSSSTALAAVSSYSGISVNASYDVQLKHGFALSYVYRGNFTDSAGTGYSRSLALVSLKWMSNSGKIFENQ